MEKRVIDLQAIARDEDCIGNNAAFTCPICGNIYIVSKLLHPNGRSCPACGKSRGYAKSGQHSKDEAWIEWE